MAIPIGSQSRLLRNLTRVGLLAILLPAPAAMWWPSQVGWSMLILATLAVVALWLMWRSSTDRQAVPGNLLNVALLALLLVAAGHLVRSGLIQPQTNFNLAGRFDAAMVLHLALLPLLVLLVQDTLGRTEYTARPLSVIGLSAAIGALAGLWMQRGHVGCRMIALIGWAGLAMYLTPMWRRHKGNPLAHTHHWRRLVGLHWRPLSALALAAALAGMCPASMPMVLIAAGGALAVCAAVIPGERIARAAIALALLAGGVGLLAWGGGVTWPGQMIEQGSWLGRGEQALADVHGFDPGPVVLAAWLGWVGVAALAIGLLGSLLWPMASARLGRRDDQARAILWCFVLMLVTLALLSPGGLFTPAVCVMFAAGWGLWPGMLRRRPRRRSGWSLIALTGLVAVLMGVVHHTGMVAWAARILGAEDQVLHGVFGWLFTHILLWQCGRSWKLALLAIAASAAAALGGELVQTQFTGRAGQWSDAAGHLVGLAVAVVLHAGVLAGRWCESHRKAERGYVN